LIGVDPSPHIGYCPLFTFLVHCSGPHSRQAQIGTNNKAFFQKAKAKGKALQDKENAAEKKHELAASCSRPWYAKPDDQKSKPKAVFGDDWKKVHMAARRLSFPYSSNAKLPSPEDFDEVLLDRLSYRPEAQCLVLACLSQKMIR
jgi:hypothetical protein